MLGQIPACPVSSLTVEKRTIVRPIGFDSAHSKRTHFVERVAWGWLIKRAGSNKMTCAKGGIYASGVLYSTVGRVLNPFFVTNSLGKLQGNQVSTGSR